MAFFTRKKLLPYQPGARKYVARYGDELAYVRYRFDTALKKRRITGELVVEKKD